MKQTKAKRNTQAHMNKLPAKPFPMPETTPINAPEVPVSAYLHSRKKRMLDLVFTIIVLPGIILLLSFCALAILLTMGFPLIFAQNRVGINGKVFMIYKLRTLKRKASNKTGITHTNGDITPLGKLMRLFRFDELPQIWNILRGEMSWVGPRPEVPYYTKKYTELNPGFRNRLLALPGITGLAQLHNPNATPSDNPIKLEFDLDYISTASLSGDIYILFKTFFLLWK
jgi:lipopolysaccharide/colanic/teichoic acid biosynthesis glycosyltransferase